MSLFVPAKKSEKELARERKDSLKRLVAECAPDVSWIISFSRLRAWVEDAHHPSGLGPVQPLMMAIHERPGAGAKERYLWSALSSHPDMLFPFELVQQEVEEQALKYGHFPGVLLFNEPCYVPAFARAYPSVRVAATGPLPAEALEYLVRLEADNKRVRPFAKQYPPLAESSPALRACHMAALVSATNALTAAAPWNNDVPESQVFRVRFPGGATVADGYSLPAGEVYWVNVVGHKLVQEVAMLMQRAQAEGKPPNFNLNIPPQAVPSIFGAFVFRRRCDAETKVMNAQATDMVRAMQRGVPPRFPVRPEDLPLPALPNEADRLCTVCGRAGAVACGVCGEVSYCAPSGGGGSEGGASGASGPGGGSDCAAEHRPAHDLTCCARKKRGPPIRPDALSHCVRPVLQCAMTRRDQLPAEDLALVAAGGVPIVGRIEHIFQGQEAPLPLLHDGKGSVSRPPLLELARLTRALAAVAAFVRENRWLSTVFLPMEEEVAVVLPDLPGMGEHCGPGLGGRAGGMAWVRTDPLFCAQELPPRQHSVEKSQGNIKSLWDAQVAQLEGVNNEGHRQDVEKRRLEAVRQMAAREAASGGGGGHGHSH